MNQPDDNSQAHYLAGQVIQLFYNVKANNRPKALPTC